MTLPLDLDGLVPVNEDGVAQDPNTCPDICCRGPDVGEVCEDYELACVNISLADVEPCADEFPDAGHPSYPPSRTGDVNGEYSIPFCDSNPADPRQCVFRGSFCDVATQWGFFPQIVDGQIRSWYRNSLEFLVYVGKSAHVRSVVTLVGSPTGGTLKLRIGTSMANFETTGDIAFDATAATVETAIEALPITSGIDVQVSGPAGGPWAIEFDPDNYDIISMLRVVGVLDSMTGGTIPHFALSFEFYNYFFSVSGNAYLTRDCSGCTTSCVCSTYPSVWPAGSGINTIGESLISQFFQGQKNVPIADFTSPIAIENSVTTACAGSISNLVWGESGTMTLSFVGTGDVGAEDCPPQEDCDCPDTYRQARNCDGDALVDLWMLAGDTPAIGSFSVIASPDACYYFDPTTSETPGTIITPADVTVFDSCVECEGETCSEECIDCGECTYCPDPENTVLTLTYAINFGTCDSCLGGMEGCLVCCQDTYCGHECASYAADDAAHCIALGGIPCCLDCVDGVGVSACNSLDISGEIELALISHTSTTRVFYVEIASPNPGETIEFTVTHHCNMPGSADVYEVEILADGHCWMNGGGGGICGSFSGTVQGYDLDLGPSQCASDGSGSVSGVITNTGCE